MDKPLNILLVHCHYRLAGGEDVVFADECALLKAHGHHVTLYERRNDEATGAAAPAQKLLLPLRAVYNFQTVREVRALIRQNHIDLVHVHNTLLVISPSVLRAAQAEGVPVVQTLHNFRLFCPSGVLLRHGQVCEDCPRHSLLCAVRHRCYRGSLAQSAVCAAVYGFHRLLGSYRHVDLIALTEFDRQKLLEFNTHRPVFDPARLFVKPNMVRLDGADAAAPLPLTQRKNQIVFAGRLEELKGLRTAIEAWNLLKQDAGGSAAPELIVCGIGPLQDWARQAAAGANVSFRGQVSHAALHALLAESRAALAPSLCYESFALVPAEAHALGTPVLASDLGNVGAAVREGVDGLHFAPGDPAALADAVRRLNAAAQAMDPAAMRKNALAAFAPEENYRRLMAIYRKILARQTPGKENP